MKLLTRNIHLRKLLVFPAIVLFVMIMVLPALAADDADSQAELAKKLANPVAALVSLPLQGNWDLNNGPQNTTRFTLNIQPVIPFSMGENWNLITRTILPVIYAESPVRGGTTSEGIGDLNQSFFVSPKDPTSSGWIWGVGPVFYYPTGSEELSSKKWGVGPTAVVLKQDSGWTYGMLANHIESFSGPGPNYISSTFLQPFLAYTTKTYTTFNLGTETTYNWREDQWTVPITVSASQVLKLGGIPVSLQLGGRVYAEKPDGGPNWGIRFAVTFMFPK